MTAKVSVIIPCFNAEPWIRATVGSVISQDYENIEMIAIDDGSTDKTAEILREEFPSVHLIQITNQGAIAARNTGTSASSGEFIQYLDSDDLLPPEKVRKHVKLLEDSAADVAYGGWQEIDTQGEAVSGIRGDFRMEDPEVGLLLGWRPTGAYLFRKRIVDAAGGWPAGLPIIHDKRFVQECALSGAKFVYCPGVSTFYRLTPGSLSTDKAQVARDLYKNASEIRERWDAHGGITEGRGHALLQSWIDIANRCRKWDRSLVGEIKQRLEETEWWKHPGMQRVRQRTEAGRVFYSRFVRANQLVFDVGANHGDSTRLFLGLGARVVAIEPNPDCAEVLRENFGNEERFVMVQSALGAETGSAELVIASFDPWSSLSRDWIAGARQVPEMAHCGWKRTETVAMTTIDQLIETFGKPSYCKVDVQGFEFEVLSGLSTPIGALSFQYTPWRIDEAVRCMRRLESMAGYRFNYSVGESMEFAASKWMNANEMQRILVEQLAGEKGTQGDVSAILP